MTTASDLASALNDVPDVLMDAADRGARDAALESLEALGMLKFDPGVLVVIGGGGSGKSSIVNALVGSDVVDVSPLRPTTTGVSMIGRSDPAPVKGPVEYVFTDDLRDGIVVVDTPSWDHERDTVLAAVAQAHTVVVVLTPARYGDAVTSETVRGLPDKAKVALVANRMPADQDDNDEVLDDIESTFGQAVFAQVVEGEPIELSGSLIAALPVDTQFLDAKRSRESAAASAGRRIARSVSSSAAELADVKRSLAETTSTPAGRDVAPSGGDWAAVREDLVAVATGWMTTLDDDIVNGSRNELSVRILESVAKPDITELQAAIDAWRIDTAATFRRRSEPRWRRTSTFQLLDRWSWRMGVDARAKPPRRVRRAMRGAMEATAREARAKLFDLLDATVASRLEGWAAVVSEVGDYQPGMLFAASDALDGGESADG